MLCKYWQIIVKCGRNTRATNKWLLYKYLIADQSLALTFLNHPTHWRHDACKITTLMHITRIQVYDLRLVEALTQPQSQADATRQCRLDRCDHQRAGRHPQHRAAHVILASFLQYRQLEGAGRQEYHTKCSCYRVRISCRKNKTFTFVYVSASYQCFAVVYGLSAFSLQE